MALALQASELLRHAPAAVATRFIDSRLGGKHGGVLGTLAAGSDLGEIVERATVTRKRQIETGPPSAPQNRASQTTTSKTTTPAVIPLPSRDRSTAPSRPSRT